MFAPRRKRLSPFVFLPYFALIAFLFAAPAQASGGLDPADPMVKITFAKSSLDAPAVLAAVSREVSAATGLGEELITYYWQTFDAIHCMGKPATDKPIFVDLYVPGFMTDQEVGKIMTAIADSLAKNAKIDKKWVFVHTHYPLQDQVFISGEVSHWDNYHGKPAKRERDIEDRAMGRFMFNDGAFVFQSLWRTGLIASGATDLGELLTTFGKIKDYDREGWHTAWMEMAARLQALGEEYEAAKHNISAQQAFYRATTYYRAAATYLFGNDPRGLTTWQKGRDTFLKACKLSDGRIKPVRIPYEKTTLPGYLVTPDGAKKKRPLLLIQTGLDGTAEDLYFIMAVQAAKRGYTCLVYEGPGQGEMITLQDLPFRYDWEKVVTPVVDFAVTLPEVDASRMAIIGYSMGGYLVPRALAFEKRIRWGIVDGGVVSPYEGTMTKLPAEVKQSMDKPELAARVNELTTKEMDKHADLNQFVNQLLWTYHGETPFKLFEKMKKFTVVDTIGKITAEMLVVNSSQDQVAGSNAQAKEFFNLLTTKKTYLEFDASQGTQFHCQLGAPMASSERILNWLDERAKP